MLGVVLTERVGPTNHGQLLPSIKSLFIILLVDADQLGSEHFDKLVDSFLLDLIFLDKSLNLQLNEGSLFKLKLVSHLVSSLNRYQWM